MKSPKHPQSVTLLKYAEKKVKNVKNNINNKLPHSTFLTCIPYIKKKPKKSSKTTTKSAKNKLSGISHSKPKTSKYSWSLYEKPNGSINFKKPENNKKTAYENLIKDIIILLEITFVTFNNIENTCIANKVIKNVIFLII